MSMSMTRFTTGYVVVRFPLPMVVVEICKKLSSAKQGFLFERLKKVVSKSLKHRNIYESKFYYRLLRLLFRIFII